MAMKPIAPKPFTTPKPRVKRRLLPDPNRPKNPVTKGLEFLFGDNSNSNIKKKGTPAGPKGKKEMPYTGPRREKNPNLKPAVPKKKTPGVVIKPPLRAKKKY